MQYISRLSNATLIQWKYENEESWQSSGFTRHTMYDSVLSREVTTGLSCRDSIDLTFLHRSDFKPYMDLQAT
jgi:hypothetical protein